MILNDEHILERIERGSIGFDCPALEPEQVQPASLDVRLGEDVYLHPGNFSLPFTMERIEMPTDLAAFLTGRSSLGRKGVTAHCTAGWIDPGFEGNITLEMVNHSGSVKTFEEGERVAQLIFMELTGHAEYDGQYQGQGPQ